MNDFEGFEIPELSDQDMQGLEPLSLGDSKAENPGLVKGPFNQYVPADKMVGGVTAREYYGGNQSSRRQTQAEVDEKRLGVLKPIGQFVNSIMSPGFGEGIVTGPINAVSSLGNAIGDWVQGKEIDTSDAWRITPEAAAAANPIRAIGGDTDITPQDVGGREWGGILAGELAGVATGSTIINKLSKVPALVRLGQAALQTRNARRLAVAARTNRRVRTAVNFGRFGGEALFDTSMSTVFQDPLGGNSANLGDLAGLNLPGRVEEGDNYLEAFGKSMLVDGVLLPLQLIGVGALIPRVRRFAADGDLPQFVTDLADAELAPYTPGQAGGALTIPEPVNTRVRAVSLVDDQNHRQLSGKRLPQHKASLGQRAFGGVNKEHDTIDHAESTFDLTTEVGVARGVNHVDGDFFPAGVWTRVGDRGVLGQNRDAFFFFQISGVHGAVGDGSVGGESTRLGEHGINQGGLTVVYVSDDGDVSHVIASGMSHESVLRGLVVQKLSTKALLPYLTGL